MSQATKHVPENIKSLKAYQPGKTTSEIKRVYELEHVVKLASNENPLPPSKKVIAAITENLSELARYPEDAAPDLKQALAEYTQSSVEQIVLGSGSSGLLEMIARIFLHPGENLIINEYSFVLYRILAKAVGADVIMTKEKDYHQDLQAMLNAINEKTRLIMLANPNNPTGTWIPATELFAFIEKVPDDIIVVIDEAYYEYMDDAEYQSALSLLPKYPNLIIARTFSKAYALAGLRFGYCVASEEVASLIQRLRKPFNVDNITLVAALAALADKKHLENTLVTNKKGLRQLGAFFSELNLPVIEQSCNFITVDFAEKATEIAEELLKQGVIVRPLAPYNMPNHLRISVGTEEENHFFMQQLKRVLKEVSLNTK